MSRDLEYPPRGYTTQDIRAVIAAERPRQRRRRARPAPLALLLVLVLVAALAIWTAASAAIVTAAGERSGVVERFERVGRLCPTWEGEAVTYTALGAVAERWPFTVRDSALAVRVDSLYQAGARATLGYESHPPAPTRCLGETTLVVTTARAGAARLGRR